MNLRISEILEGIDAKVQYGVEAFIKARDEYNQIYGFEPITTFEESSQNIQNILSFMKTQYNKKLKENPALMEELTAENIASSPRRRGGFRKSNRNTRKNKKSRKYKR
jgi:hypothetical protein